MKAVCLSRHRTGNREDYEGLLVRMNDFGFKYKEVNNDIQLFGLLV